MGKYRMLLPAAFAMVICLCSCGSNDAPPVSSSPEPAAHSGVYSGACGTLAFNGDGSSVEFALSPAVAEAAGLPAEGSGEYAFLFGGGLCRYDTAEYFELTAGDAAYRFMNRHGQTSEDSIYLASPVDDSTMVFERGKENGKSN